MIFGRALKKGAKAKTWTQGKGFMGLSLISAPCCFGKLGVEGWEGTLLELKKHKFEPIFKIKSSSSDLDALTILDHACKIIKHSFSTQTTSEKSYF